MIKEYMIQNTHFINRINTGGGHEVDYYLKAKNDKILKAIIINEEGYNLYTIFVDEYKKIIEEKQEFLKNYFDEKIIKYNDIEWLFWITLEHFDFMENAIVFNYSVEYETADYYDHNGRKREKICRDIMEIFLNQ